jgi:hypothetical protein
MIHVKDFPGEEIPFLDHEEHGASQISEGNSAESDYRQVVLPFLSSEEIKCGN